MKVAILGATRGMGRALSRLMAERQDSVCLLGRDLKDLEASAADLRVRGGAGTSVSVAVCDLEKPDSFEKALEQAEENLSGLDTVVVTAGLFAEQTELEANEPLLRRVLQTDFTHTVLFCEAARKRLLARGGGTLCVFSSVAGDRGRTPVVLYGAAKAGLSAYLEGLDHRYRREGLKTVCVKPGFVRTDMTAGLKEPPFAADAEEVAEQVMRGILAGSPVVYAPRAWWWVMTAVKSLPRFAMRRLSF